MILKKWDELPSCIRTEEVRKYYDILYNKQITLILKRIFDIVVSAFLLLVLSPVFLILSIMIKIDSPGPVFYRQIRVTQYGEQFRIFKFRTMYVNSDKDGKDLTVKNDNRITKVGKMIRKLRLDEISQLLDVFRGKMTFVATRPETVKYVEQYTPEMMATLLLPAGVTSLASIYYKDEDLLLENAEDTDKLYIEKILPQKMYYNLKEIENFNLFSEIKIMFMTVFAVLGKVYDNNANDANDANVTHVYNEKYEVEIK